MGSPTKMRLSVILLFALIGIALAAPQAGKDEAGVVAESKDEESQETAVGDVNDENEEDESSDVETAAETQKGSDKEKGDKPDKKEERKNAGKVRKMTR